MHMGGNAHIVSLLLQYGASVHAVAQDSTTALHFASQQGHLNVVTQLIKKGARVNVKTSKTWMTPLHMALSKGHINVAVELIKKGAVQKYNSKGILPLDMVSEEVESSLEEALGNEAMERLRDVQDTPKEVKPPVAFYNRKKGKKNKEVYTEKGATDNNTQTEINKEN